MTGRRSPQDRAVEAYYEAHPEDADLPPEKIQRLLVVASGAFHLALVDMFDEIMAALVLRGRYLAEVKSWTFCPRCFEVVCDDDCRNYALRHRAGCWRDEETT